MSLISQGAGVLWYPWYQVLSGGRVSLDPSPFWGRGQGIQGVGYLAGVRVSGGRVSRVEATAAVGMHPTGMLSCYESIHVTIGQSNVFHNDM